MAAPPRVRLPALLQGTAFALDTVGFLEWCRARYGDVFEVRLPGIGRFVYVADPALIKQVFAADRDIGLAGEARRPFFEPLLGTQSLLTTDGEQWERQRKLIGPPFHGELIENYRQQIYDIAAAEVDRWPRGMPMPLRPRMQAITLEVILRLVFGIEDAARLNRLRALLPALADQGAWLFWLPESFRPAWFPPLRKLFETKEEVDAILFDEIAHRRADPDVADRNDILSLLIAQSDADDQELRDELLTLLAAGHETTATALAWAFERLARHPHVVERIRAEEDGEEYIDAVVKETLRIRPVIMDVIRKLKEPMQLGQWEIPVDRHPTPGIALVQRDGAIHDDRLAFRPERFLDPPPDAEVPDRTRGGMPRGGRQPSNFEYLPFGGGVRRCLGASFAQFEMKVVLGTILRHARVRAPKPRAERIRRRSITFAPSSGGRIVASPA